MRISDWSSDVCSSDLLASALLGLSDPRRPLRRLRPAAGAGGGVASRPARGCRLRPPRQSPGAPSALEAHGLSEVRRRRRARYRNPGHLRRFLLVLHALLQPAAADAAGTRGGVTMAAGRTRPDEGCVWEEGGV